MQQTITELIEHPDEAIVLVQYVALLPVDRLLRKPLFPWVCACPMNSRVGRPRPLPHASIRFSGFIVAFRSPSGPIHATMHISLWLLPSPVFTAAHRPVIAAWYPPCPVVECRRLVAESVPAAASSC